jgi:DnaK suppressor protein
MKGAQTLTKADVQQFKKRLEEIRCQITNQLKSCTDDVKKPDEATGYSQHQADQGTDDFDRHISLEVTAQEFNLLRLVDRALEKIEEGTYGICDITGEKIPEARLKVMPYANTTVKAQEMLEKGLI